MKVKLYSIQELLNDGFVFNQDGSTLRKDSEKVIIGSILYPSLGNEIVVEIEANEYWSMGGVHIDKSIINKIYQEPELLNLIQRQEIYGVAAEKWGVKPQMVAAIEELAELIVELAKQFNGKRESYSELIDELADAEIMIEQQKQNFNVENKTIERKDYKIRRLRNILGMD